MQEAKGKKMKKLKLKATKFQMKLDEVESLSSETTNFRVDCESIRKYSIQFP